MKMAAEIVLGRFRNVKTGDCLPSLPNGSPGNAPRFNADEAKSPDDSLKRLGRDWIDLFFFHSPFEVGEIEDDVWQGLAELKQTGKSGLLAIRFPCMTIPRTVEQWMSERKIDAVQIVLGPNRETVP